MAEAAVSLAVELIGRFLIQKAEVLHGVRGQVHDLWKELSHMQRFLKSADAKQNENDQIRDWVAEIREVAYDAEDAIATFVLEVESKKGPGAKNFFLRSFHVCNEAIARYKIWSQINGIKSDIARLKGSLVSFGLPTATTERASIISTTQRRTYYHDVEHDFVGFEDDIKILMAKLLSEDRHRRVVSICGMGGLGKTTLAKKLCEKVGGRFDAIAWVCISQHWQLKDVLQRILTCLIPGKSNEIVNMVEDRLVELLNTFMQEKKCLVVLDDIWSEMAWDDLSPAFPRANSSSKIMLTTRNKNVAAYADPLGHMHDLECLTKEEGLELLLKKAILPTAERTLRADFDIDPDKKKLGSEMVEQCGCLPLAIVVLGGLLATKHSLIEWEEVHRNIGSYLEGRKDYVGEYRRMSKVLDLSYRELSYELKACFLYLASFPEDFDIEAETLYHLWTAEGFLLQKDDTRKTIMTRETIMEIAEQKLGELAQRCMVQVKLELVNKGGRRFESLRLHDLMRDFCWLKANEKNFLNVINFGLEDEQVQHLFSNSSSTGSSGSSSPKIHRLAIQFPDEDGVSKLELLAKKAKMRDIRTLLFFCPKFNVEDQLVLFSKGLRLLRVLSFISNRNNWFGEDLPKQIGNLILLRYLGLQNTGFRKLPSSIANLRYLQTLDLRGGTARDVPNILWKMEGLIHLYLPYYRDFFSTDGSMLRVDGLSNLKTLENFAPDKVDIKGLFNLSNLRELNTICISEKLDLLKEVNNYLINSGHLQQASIEILCCHFPSKQELSILRQLLGCDCLVELKILGTIIRLPKYNSQLYQSLTSLTLFSSELKKDPMPTLEKLTKLGRLCLLGCAFVGKKMVCSSHGFPNLKYLHLDHLPNLEEWKVDNAMPNLSTLIIEFCDKLKMLPDGLQFNSTLQKLQISHMNLQFCKRLRVGGEDYHKVPEITSILVDQICDKIQMFFKHSAVLSRGYLTPTSTSGSEHSVKSE